MRRNNEIKIIGYSLYLQKENYTKSWIPAESYNDLLCSNSQCQSLTQEEYYNENFKIRKPKEDLVSICIGGVYLVSRRFKEFVNSCSIDNVECIVLPRMEEFFLLKCKNIININPEILDPYDCCEICHKPLSISRSKAVKKIKSKTYLDMKFNVNHIASKGFYFTDIKF